MLFSGFSQCCAHDFLFYRSIVDRLCYHYPPFKQIQAQKLLHVYLKQMSHDRAPFAYWEMSLLENIYAHAIQERCTPVFFQKGQKFLNDAVIGWSVKVRLQVLREYLYSPSDRLSIEMLSEKLDDRAYEYCQNHLMSHQSREYVSMIELVEKLSLSALSTEIAQYAVSKTLVFSQTFGHIKHCELLAPKGSMLPLKQPQVYEYKKEINENRMAFA